MVERGGLRLPRSMSLAAQLLLIFVSLVAGSTLVLTVAAYRSSLSSLEADARRAVRVAAQTRDDAMTQLFTTRIERAEGFLAAVQSLCGEQRGDGRLAFSDDCVNTMVQEFRTAERASGVRLEYLSRTLSATGTNSSTVLQPGATAAIVEGPGGADEYRISASRDAALLTVQFDGSQISSLFSQRVGLGDAGEVFLSDANGRPLTPLRYATQNGSAVEPMMDCRNGPDERTELDYRGVQTIHGVRRASVLDGGCIDAHVNYAEALAPSENLRSELVGRGAAFVLMGALLSLIAAHRTAAPVRRLADSARQIQAGRFNEEVPVGGPSEVRALGEALAAMSAEIEKLVRREQSARREAEDANRSKDHFLATLSHELRTPLNAIFGWSRLLRNGVDDADRLQRSTEAIERSAESLRRLVDDLLDVSRITSGRLHLVRTPFRLAAAIEAALDAVRTQAVERGINLQTQLPSDDVFVLGDQQRLQQVVWNLLWNAIKFTPAGGAVRLSLRADTDRAELEVTDTGAGIAPESLAQIFGWFRQAEAGEQAIEPGMGVGLALVKQIVELHGGTVRAESSGPGTGATFRVSLPVVRGQQRRGESVPRLTPDAQPLASIRILVVEDDREWRAAAFTLLTDAGATVRVVGSAAEARHALSTFLPDVLVSDIAMPEEDGYSLLESLRGSGDLTPAVALTAFARPEDAERARQAGFQVHLAKPVDPSRLVEAVAAVSRSAQP